jgi:hypothetical protein
LVLDQAGDLLARLVAVVIAADRVLVAPGTADFQLAMTPQRQAGAAALTALSPYIT